MTESYRVVDVRQSGPRSEVALKTDRLSDEVVVQRLFDELDQLVRTSGCEVLAIDIDGIRLLPSHFIGQLVSLRRRVKIELLNASEYVELVLQTARLSKLFETTADSETVSGSEPV